MSDVSPNELVIDAYRQLVDTKHPDAIQYWPLISGYNVKIGQHHDYAVVVMNHTGASGYIQSSAIGHLTDSLVGFSNINPENIDRVRKNIDRHFGVKSNDFSFIIKSDLSNLGRELQLALRKHENYLGRLPMKVFLSHKGIDKPRVRDFKETLSLLGFQPWLDEDAMHAGVELERGIIQGFKESCAAVFFITPNFVDESYLSSEVNYAIAEKRKKGKEFSIITLVYEIDGKKGIVPELLEPYVWKEPRSDMEAFRELLRALPVQCSGTEWK